MYFAKQNYYMFSSQNEFIDFDLGLGPYTFRFLKNKHITSITSESFIIPYDWEDDFNFIGFLYSTNPRVDLNIGGKYFTHAENHDAIAIYKVKIKWFLKLDHLEITKLIEQHVTRQTLLLKNKR